MESNGRGDDAEKQLLAQVIAACQAGIANALKHPSEAIGFAKGLESALRTMSLVADESRKGRDGNAAIGRR